MCRRDAIESDLGGNDPDGVEDECGRDVEDTTDWRSLGAVVFDLLKGWPSRGE